MISLSLRTELSLSSCYLPQAHLGLTLSATDVGKGTCNEGVSLKAEFIGSGLKTEGMRMGRAREREQEQYVVKSTSHSVQSCI